jgi:hypothetical protein
MVYPVRILLFLLVTLLSLVSCRSGSEEDTEISTDVVHNPNSAESDGGDATLPVITFQTMEHDFGRILEGETVSFEFQFTNTGKSDLLLAEVTSSCGCTIPSYSKAPIRPQEKGVVKVSFNSQGRRGFQTKSVLVASNTQPNTVVLRIKAQVVNPSSKN